MVALSWLLPAWVAVFIIFFDTYWLLKTIYLSLHLRATFSAMRKNVKIHWLEKIDKFPYHLVILPMYNEPHEVVEESLASLARANYPKEKMIVVLALEERGGAAAREVGRRIGEQYGTAFYKFLITAHPTGLSHEIPGKGSNEAWAAARAKDAIIDPLRIDYRNILVSVFDIDTQVLRIFWPADLRIFEYHRPVPRHLPTDTALYEQHL